MRAQRIMRDRRCCEPSHGHELTSTMATLRFGQHIIKSSAVFLKTELSFALVNRKPVVPGQQLCRSLLLLSNSLLFVKFGLTFTLGPYQQMFTIQRCLSLRTRL
ncbi:hypothetical protein QQF64_003139 [Cirrhinus molitorella]|uniref:Uncharacterized protein n=1 Tax=Cirrhinus molitorella TaxID=172907 RepID=A0ABR3MJ71_9TELE